MHYVKTKLAKKKKKEDIVELILSKQKEISLLSDQNKVLTPILNRLSFKKERKPTKSKKKKIGPYSRRKDIISFYFILYLI